MLLSLGVSLEAEEGEMSHLKDLSASMDRSLTENIINNVTGAAKPLFSQ